MKVFRMLPLLACACAMAAPAAASAAPTASVSGGVLSYTASGPESNSVTITSGGGAIVIADQGVQALVPGAGCSRLTARQVSCPSASLTSIDVSAGDGDDTVSVALFFTAATVDGGAGNDTITGGAADDVLDGGAGGDSLAGGWGDDRLEGGASGDRLVGNGGVDSVSYADRSAAVGVSLDGAANDGEAGEGDNVDAENLVGGSGADVLSGNGDANGFSGGAGDDSLSGGSGPDALDGGAGADAVTGGPGADSIAAREGEVDEIGCGSEGDAVVADTADAVASDCETVDKPHVAQPQPPATPPAVAPPPPVHAPPAPASVPAPAPGPAPLLTDAPGIEIGRMASVTPAGTVAISLACPAAAPGACSGSILLALPEESYVAARAKTVVAARRRRVARRVTRGRKKFEVAPGARTTLVMELRAHARRTVRRHGRMHVQARVTAAGETKTYPLTLTLERRAARRR